LEKGATRFICASILILDKDVEREVDVLLVIHLLGISIVEFISRMMITKMKMITLRVHNLTGLDIGKM
jgi:hypothetical protein